MTDPTFEKISPSDRCLYGGRKLLICGFPAAAQTKFHTLLQMIDFNKVPIVWVSAEQSDMLMAELMALSDSSGQGVSSDLPRAIIAAGITEGELIRLMSACKKSGMAKTLWATLTPTSEKWRLTSLLSELAAEHAALNDKP